MSTPQLQAAIAIWRARKNRTGGDRVSLAYLLLMVAAIAMAPVIRALWLGSTSTAGLMLLTADQAPDAVSSLTALIWSSALLLGRLRGPALLPPFLLYAVANSGMKRSLALRRPVIQAAAWASLLSVSVAGFSSAALLTSGHAGILGILGFLGAALTAGIIGALLALVGQALPRTATCIGIGIIAVASLGGTSPRSSPFLPWAWAGAAYPVEGAGAECALLPLAGLTALALVLIVFTSRMLNSLNFHQLGSQAAKWDAVVTFSSTLDFSLAATVYRAGPRFGSRIRAVRTCSHLAMTFLVRDAIGLLRTPVRLVVALGMTIASGVLLSTASITASSAVLPATGAALVLYLATGVLGQGLQHAAHVAADYPLYGISDRTLVVYHALFPFFVSALLVSATVVACSAGSVGVLGTPVLETLALVVLILLTRLGAALKGPLPPRLLTPIETPAGDLSIVAQLAWAFGELLLAILAGMTAAIIPLTPVPALVMIVYVTIIAAVRWRKRR